MPDDVAHKAGNVDRIVGSALLEILYQPLFGLIVDELVVIPDAGFAQSISEGVFFRHIDNVQGIVLFCKDYFALTKNFSLRMWKLAA